MRRLPVDDISILMGNLNNLFGTLDELGVPTAPILDRNHQAADELSVPHAWIPLRKYIQILGDILDSTTINGLGLKAGDRMELRDQGLFGYATASCSNLSKAIDTLNIMGTTPEDIIAILQKMKSMGALHAELIVE